MRLITLSLLLLIFSSGFSQSTNKRYRSHVGNEGTSYFFVSKKLSHKKGVEKFEFDMTHLSTTDSVTLNFTIITKLPSTVRTMSLVNDSCNIKASNLSMLYRDILDDGYEIRTTSRFALKDIQQLFSHENTLRFTMSLNDNCQAYATYSRSQWKKERETITRILNSIMLLK